MRFLLDECVPRHVGERLRADGHSVASVYDTTFGVPDEQVLSLSVGDDAILITEDKDFGTLVRKDGLRAIGVVLLRLGALHPVDRAALVSAFVKDSAPELPGSFRVLTPTGTRIRALP